MAEDVGTALRSALEAGAMKVAEPEIKPWGQTVAYMRYPDGLLVNVGSPTESQA